MFKNSGHHFELLSGEKKKQRRRQWPMKRCMAARALVSMWWRKHVRVITAIQPKQNSVCFNVPNARIGFVTI